MDKVHLSVVVTSYNYEKYIGQTLSSLVNQTVKDFEIIVVDDGSTDNSVPLIKAYCGEYPEIRFYQHEGGINRGLPESLRLGISKASGKYIAFCESDDFWDACHVEKLLDYLVNNEDAYLIFNYIKVINELSDEKVNDYAGECNKFLSNHHKKNIFLSLLNNYMPTFSATCIQRDLLMTCDFRSYYSQYIDFWLWRQLCLKYPIHFLSGAVTYWRRHGESYDCRENIEDITDFLFANNQLLKKQVSYSWLDKVNVYLFRCFHKSRLKIIEHEMNRIYLAR